MSNIEKTALSSLLDDLPVALNAALGAGIGSYGLKGYNKLVEKGTKELAENSKNIEELRYLKSRTKSPLKTKEILDYEDALNKYNSGLTKRMPGETIRTRRYYEDLDRFNDIHSRSVASPTSLAAMLAKTKGSIGNEVVSGLVPGLAAGAIGGQEAMLASMLAPKLLSESSLPTQALSAAAAAHLGDIGLSHITPGIQQSLGSSPGILKTLSDNLFSGYARENAQTIANSLATDKNKILTYLNPTRAFDELSDVPRYYGAGIAGKYLLAKKPTAKALEEASRKSRGSLTEAALEESDGYMSEIAKYLPGLGLYNKYLPSVKQRASNVKSKIDKKRYINKEMKEIEKLLAPQTQKTSNYRNFRKTAFPFIGRAGRYLGGKAMSLGTGVWDAATGGWDSAKKLVTGRRDLYTGNVANKSVGRASHLATAAQGRGYTHKANAAAPTTVYDPLKSKLESQVGTGGFGLTTQQSNATITGLNNLKPDDMLRSLVQYGNNANTWAATGAIGGGALGAYQGYQGEGGLSGALGGAMIGAGVGAAGTRSALGLKRLGHKSILKAKARMSPAGVTPDQAIRGMYDTKMLGNTDFMGREIYKVNKLNPTTNAEALKNIAKVRSGVADFNSGATGYIDDYGNFTVGVGSNQAGTNPVIAGNIAERMGSYNPSQFNSTVTKAFNSADQPALQTLMTRAAGGDEVAQRSMNAVTGHLQELSQIQHQAYNDIASNVANTLNSSIRGLGAKADDLVNHPSFTHYVDQVSSGQKDEAAKVLQDMMSDLNYSLPQSMAGTANQNLLNTALNATTDVAEVSAGNMTKLLDSKASQLTSHINESSRIAINSSISQNLEKSNAAIQSLNQVNPGAAQEITARLNAGINELSRTGNRAAADKLLQEVSEHLTNNSPDEAIRALKKLRGASNPYSNQGSEAINNLATAQGKNFVDTVESLKGRIPQAQYSTLKSMSSLSDEARSAALSGDTNRLRSLSVTELQRTSSAIDPDMSARAFTAVNNELGTITTNAITAVGATANPAINSQVEQLLKLSVTNPKQFEARLLQLEKNVKNADYQAIALAARSAANKYTDELANGIVTDKAFIKLRKGSGVSADFSNPQKLNTSGIITDTTQMTQPPVQSNLSAPVSQAPVQSNTSAPVAQPLATIQSNIAAPVSPTQPFNFGNVAKRGLIGAGVAGVGYGGYNMLQAPTSGSVYTAAPAVQTP